MSDMKCPACGGVAKLGINQQIGKFYYCLDCNITSTQKPWQELIRTRKALEQSEICCTEWEKQALDYKAENIALSGDLERTRRALEIAVDALKRIAGTNKECDIGWKMIEMKNNAHDTLNQIKTALE